MAQAHDGVRAALQEAASAVLAQGEAATSVLAGQLVDVCSVVLKQVPSDVALCKAIKIRPALSSVR